MRSPCHLPYTVFSILLLSLSLLEDLDCAALAAPSFSSSQFHQLSLSRGARTQRNATEWGWWASYQGQRLSIKYGAENALTKRASGMNLLTNQNDDSSYFGSLTVGTPPVSYNVVLDTGSSDFWLATEKAFQADQMNSTPYNPSASSSFMASNNSFSIKYGSGGATGVLGTDTVQMAGFTVDDQVLGVVSNMTENMLTAPVSGLLGLAFPSIAMSHATPFWLNIAAQPQFLDDTVMSFQLTRYLDDSTAADAEPGGTFTFGAVNSSLYSGDIDYQNVPDGHVGYWILEVNSLVVQNTTLSMPSAPSYAAIDTGTTLVAGPVTAIAELYATIPGTCATEVTVYFNFGNSSVLWPVSPTDFQLAQLSADTCLGAFFEYENPGTTGPTWIIGDTFLVSLTALLRLVLSHSDETALQKNVYSVFRAQPAPSVGFAALSGLSQSMNGQGGALPSPTYATSVPAVTAQAGLSTTSGSSLLTSSFGILLTSLVTAVWSLGF
ncbi:hypothetical protein EUX98_g6070 [Antrodiella citrinella]|uniref:Peptidase A1 domain-containing protein n=1 Tax=Antrodiella citrinella TaxID=2447956 RepID=A0A4S4MXH7_9APHY|nr:hypothetical protein EUX98_g6070 [Antrodiella citrinella]